MIPTSLQLWSMTSSCAPRYRWHWFFQKLSNTILAPVLDHSLFPSWYKFCLYHFGRMRVQWCWSPRRVLPPSERQSFRISSNKAWQHCWLRFRNCNDIPFVAKLGYSGKMCDQTRNSCQMWRSEPIQFPHRLNALHFGSAPVCRRPAK